MMTASQARINARQNMGFLSAEEVQALASDSIDRLTMLLVRCAGCRFMAPAQDVAHLIRLVESGTDNGTTDHVRDVSFPAGAPI